MAFNLPPYAQPNRLLDLASLNDAIGGYGRGMEKAYEGETAREMGRRFGEGDTAGAVKYAFARGAPELGMKTAQFQAQQELAAREAFKSKAQMLAPWIETQVLGPNVTAEQRAANWPKVYDSPIFKGDSHFNDPKYGPLFRDPETGPRMILGLLSPYRDAMEKRRLEAEVTNLEGQYGQQEHMARLQNKLQVDLARAKSQLEVEEILRKAKAMGLDVDIPESTPSPSAGAPQRQAQAAPPPVAGTPAVPGVRVAPLMGGPPTAAPPQAPVVAPDRPAIMQGDPRFAEPAPPAAPARAAQAPTAAPTQAAQRATTTDPYLLLTQPAISPEQELAMRKKRATQTALSGDLKGAGKIMAKDEEPKEWQTKDASFAERMARSEINLLGVLGRDNSKYNPGAFWQNFAIDSNLTNSTAWRDYVGSAREWIATMLRKDTGAAVTDTEWKLYFPTYFPQPGEALDSQKMKMDRRVQAARGLRASAGPAFERMYPNFDVEMRQRLQISDPKTYGPKNAGTALPPGQYQYNPATGQVEPVQ